MYRSIYRLYTDLVDYIEQRKSSTDQELIDSKKQTGQTIKDFKKTASNLATASLNIIIVIEEIVLLNIILHMLSINILISIVFNGYLIFKLGVRILDRVMVKKLGLSRDILTIVSKTDSKLE